MTVAVLVVLAASVAAACSGGNGGARPGGTAAAATFAATIEPAPAAIMTLMDQVAGVRQLPPPKSLKVGLVARSDVPKLIDSLLTAQDRDMMAKTTTLYRLLGVLAPDENYLNVYRAFVGQSLAGVYSPGQKALWVVHPDGQATNFSDLGGSEKQTLEHELVHAVQDANFNLNAIDSDSASLDQRLTATAAIEGDAVTTQRNYDAKYAAVGVGSGVLLVDAARLQAATPAAIQRELLFPYTNGADWIDGIRQRGGNTAVDSLLREMPDGTVYVFHPERIGTGWKPQIVTLPPLGRALGDGWSKQSGGQFGQFEVQNYLQLALPGLRAVQGADGWAGDHYDVYTHGTESVAVFRIVYSSAEGASRFGQAQDDLLKAEGARASSEGGLAYLTLNDGDTTVRIHGGGATVTFVIGSTAASAKRAAEALAHG